MTSTTTMMLMARIAYYSRTIYAHIMALMRENRKVAVFMYVRSKGPDPEFLQVKHDEWGCYLFPGAQLDETTSDQAIANRCASKIGLTKTTAVTPEMFIVQRLDKYDFVSTKQSSSDLAKRVYFYRFYLLKLRDENQWPSFEAVVANSPRTRWMTHKELLNDRMTYRKNHDVIDHIMVRMNKGHDLDLRS